MNFPPELSNHIVSFIACNVVRHGNWGDAGPYDPEEVTAKDDLLACSTVCRTFRQVILPHLFHTVAMYFDPRLTESEEHEYIEDRFIRSPSEFLAMLDDCPAIRDNVQQLRLARDWENDDHGSDSDARWLVAVARKLPKLRILELQDVYFDLVAAEELIGLQPLLNLDRFYYGLRCAKMNDDVQFATVLSFMRCFEQIRDVHFDSFHFVINESETSLFPLGIESMVFRSCETMAKFFPMLLYDHAGERERERVPLHSLELCCIKEDSLDSVSKLLADVGPGLTDLTLCLEYVPDIELGMFLLIFKYSAC